MYVCVYIWHVNDSRMSIFYVQKNELCTVLIFRKLRTARTVIFYFHISCLNVVITLIVILWQSIKLMTFAPCSAVPEDGVQAIV
jgi:hypothetical protein